MSSIELRKARLSKKSASSLQTSSLATRGIKVKETVRQETEKKIIFSDLEQGGSDPIEWSYHAPDPEPIQELIAKTGYNLTITTGQRKFGGPPPESVFSGKKKNNGECFIGSLHRDAFEPEIWSLLEVVPEATVYEIRLMMGYDGKSRGFAFVSFVEDGAAQRCKALLDTKV